MIIAVVGAGLQAKAICHALLQQDDVDGIVVIDRSPDQTRLLLEAFDYAPRISAIMCDVSSYRAATEALWSLEADAIISAAPYFLNYSLTQAALDVGCSFCDLGGNNDVVRKQLALHELAEAIGIAIVPDCGLAPGLGSILTAHAVRHMKKVDSIEIRCGGLPQKRDGYVDYSIFFSPHGLINEYAEDCLVLRDGKLQTVPSLEEFEEVHLFKPFGTLEAFTTSGGASTLPLTYCEQIASLDYKTIRYPGHGRIFRALKYMGLMSETPVARGVTPRHCLGVSMERTLGKSQEDVILLSVTARGGGVTRVYSSIEYPADRLTAMMRMTGFPAAIVLMMLGRGQIEPGARPQELCVDPDIFLGELSKLGVNIAQQVFSDEAVL